MPTEVSASAGVSATVTSALKRASDATGAGFDFLKAMAARESNFDPSAKAKTSSAAGLFQFIEQTWLGAVKQYGARHGLAAEAAAIKRDVNGRFSVPDSTVREQILNLRFDSDASAKLAGELAGENKTILERRLGRAATSADLYTAHFLGPAGAVKLLTAASNAKAAHLLPQAAEANRPVFYDGARAKSVSEVITSIAKSMGGSDEAPAATVVKNTPVMRTETVAAHFVTSAPAKVSARAVETGPAILSPLSSLAISALQALDPTRLTSDRDNQNN